LVTIEELTREMNRFVQAMGWYDEDSPAPQTPRNIAVSLSLESAEVLEHFQWGEEFDRAALAGELADVGLYLLQLAYLADIDLEQAIVDKLNVNYGRVWPRSR
jgi:NTP pyrophosphatase (non-canonical NTP hydrolase)